MGQRWRYRIGNTRVDVDNAFSWSLWAQERLRVNEETVSETGGRMRIFQSWAEPWLTPIGEGVLAVKLKSVINGIRCDMTLDDEPIHAEALYEAVWLGRARSWPGETDWVQSPRPNWIALTPRS